VAGPRVTQMTSDPWDYANEKPYLIYPLGSIDDDPEALFHFQGIDPVPLNSTKDHHDHRRAVVTIGLFDLAEETLLLERAELIRNLFEDLEAGKETFINMCVNGMKSHTNCARSFVKLYRADPAVAARHYEKAVQYLKSKLYCLKRLEGGCRDFAEFYRFRFCNAAWGWCAETAGVQSR